MKGRVPGGLSRRQWRRMERRALVDYEQAVLGSLRRMAGMGHEFDVVVPATGRPSELGIVVLHAGGCRVAMAGVTALTRAHLAVYDQGALSIADAGRYGPLWWLRLVGTGRVGLGDGRWNAPVAMTITGSHVRVDPGPGEGPDHLAPAPRREVAGDG